MASVFLDYNAQIQNLKNKNLIVYDDNATIEISSKVIPKDESENKWHKRFTTSETLFIPISRCASVGTDN